MGRQRQIHFLGLVVPVVALLMVVITAIPDEFWKVPVSDAVYNGFDADLDYATAMDSGRVRVSPETIDMTAPASVNLATTLLPKLTAAVDVIVQDNRSANQAIRVGLWSPWTRTARFVVFGPAPDYVISAQTIGDGTNGPTLSGGAVIDTTTLGHYRLGQPYAVGIVLNKAIGTITTRVTSADGTNGVASVSSSLFGNVEVSLNASSLQPSQSHVVLRNFTLTIPHQRAWATRVDDPLATAVVLALTIAGFLLLATAATIDVRNRRWQGERSGQSLQWSLRPRWSVLFAVAAVIAIYVVGNATMFALGGHPFDMGDEKFYAYVARAYGPQQLYYLPNVVSLAWIWNGIPIIESAFPYEPLSAYLHAGIGWLNSLLFAGGGNFSPRASTLEYLTKAVNVAFGLIDALFMYIIGRQIGFSPRSAASAAALFLFNPAVWFSMSVWGQTHVFSISFVLLSIILAEKQRPTLAWLSLAAACLTRPQMLVFGLLLGIVLVRKFKWDQNVRAASWVVILVFLFLAPFTLATSPALPIDVIRHNFDLQEGGGNVATLTTVSLDSYSIWPLVTYVAQGASSLQRSFTPSSESLIGPISYQRMGQILTSLAMLLLAGRLLLSKRSTLESGAYLPFVALGIASFLMLLTGILATSFVLALPLLLLCRRWMSGVGYTFVVAVWTITTLVPMYGDMGVVMSSHDYPLLSRATNPITNFVASLYVWDRFITVGVVANLCAVVWLASSAFRRGDEALGASRALA